MQPEKSVRPWERRRPGVYRHHRLFSRQLLAITAAILLLYTLAPPLRPALAAPQAQGANLSIGYPFEGSTVSGVVTIQGTATAPNFLNYSLYYAAGSQVDGGTQWRYDDPIADFVPTMIVNGSLAQWDTTRIPNGQYVLALAVRESTSTEIHVSFVNNLTVYNEAATPTPEPTQTPDVELTETLEPQPTGELPPPIGATIELPATATPRPTPALVAEGTTGGSSGTGDDEEGGFFSGDLFSVKAVKEAFTIGVQLAFLLYAIGILYFLTKAVIRYYLRQTRGRSRT